jgi:hypothetical protein
MFQRFSMKPWLTAAVSLAALLGAATATAQFLPGKIRVEKYTTDAAGNPFGGVDLFSFTNNAVFPTAPTSIEYVTYAEYPQSGDINTPPAGDVENNYGIRVTGVIIPPTTGSYVFYIAADDHSRLFLSTDSSPANVVLIATEPEWNGVRAWLTADRRPAANNVSAPISLTAGQRYHFYALMKEGGGGDNWAMTWTPQGTPLDAAALPIPGTALGFVAPTTPTFTTAPQSQTVQQNRTVSFITEATGAGENTVIPTYQWFRNGVAITDATTGRYTSPQLALADNGVVFRVEADFAGTKATAQATITVTADTTPPTVVRASGSENYRNATIQFDEEMDATVEVAANYSISGGLGTPTAVTRVNPTTVRLTTAAQTPGTNYVITMTGLKDKAGNTLVANTATFKAFIFRAGVVKYERYNTTATFEDFRDNIRGKVPPDTFGILSTWEAPVNVQENYGGRIAGFVIPPTTGDYVFYMSSDDRGAVYLSTDDDPANMKLIAFEPTWNDNRDWVALDRRNADAPENRSDTFQETEWAGGAPAKITLTAGRRYYMETLWKEGGGGDNGSTTWKLASAEDPADGTPTVLTGTLIGVAVDPATLPPILVTNTPGGVFDLGGTITMSATFESELPLTYQWQKNFADIPGATSATYVITGADINAIGDYRCVARNANGSGDTGSDDNIRWIMSGAFLIEAEDFNYEGGKTVAAASVMPYLGNAYSNRIPVLDVDFNNDGDESGGAAFAYSRFVPEDAGVLELKGPGDAVDSALGRFRGSWSVTANYATGWTDAADWQNYTRTFPEGEYNVVMAAAHDGRGANEINMIMSLVANPTVADGSSPGAEGGTQGLTEIGRFLGPATGAWSSNDLIPMRGTNGVLSKVALSGTKTLRLTFNAADGDADYMLLYKAGATPPAGLTITRSGANVSVTYTGTLQSADAVTGPWADVPGATNPFSTAPSAAQKYYRSRN